MSEEISDLENRLKALLAKVDKLLKHPQATESSESISSRPAETPEKEKPPLLLKAPVPKKVPEPPALNVLSHSSEIIPLPPAPPHVSVTKNIPAKEAPPPLLLKEPVVEKVPEPVPPPSAMPEVSPPPPEPPPAVPITTPISGIPPHITALLSSEVADIPFLIGYPESMTKEADELQRNLERLEPKFTKMMFHMSGRGSVSYSANHSLVESAFTQLQDMRGGALLVITKHHLSAKSPHFIGEEMAQLGIYFQEVLVDSISKKAFYFDFLLGLVFFLKSQMPQSPGTTPESRSLGEHVDWTAHRRRD